MGACCPGRGRVFRASSRRCGPLRRAAAVPGPAPGSGPHYLDGKNGVKDFDVWSFYAALGDGPFPYRWRGTADFGPSRFGRYPGDPPCRARAASGHGAERFGGKVSSWPARPSILPSCQNQKTADVDCAPAAVRPGPPRISRFSRFVTRRVRYTLRAIGDAMRGRDRAFQPYRPCG